MKKKIKAKWIAALTSGQYTQGQKQLRHHNRFCCLGVLCDLYHKETGNGVWIGDVFDLHNDRVFASLHRDILKWAGIDDADQDMLMTYNDDLLNPRTFTVQRGHTFPEIAELIETYL